MLHQFDAACPRDRYGRTAHGYLASPYPRSLPGVPVEHNPSGISFAVANFSGLVTALRQNHSFAGIHTVLNQPTYTPAKTDTGSPTASPADRPHS